VCAYMCVRGVRVDRCGLLWIAVDYGGITVDYGWHHSNYASPSTVLGGKNTVVFTVGSQHLDSKQAVLPA
jgi:hypothetical protein